MPENDFLRRSLEAGMAFTQLTQKRAESLVKELVRSGEVSRKQAGAQVEELLERSRQNTEAFLALVRKEIDDRVSQLNLVTRDDVAALVARFGIKVPAGPTKATKTATATPKKAAGTAKKAVKKTATKAGKATTTAAKATKATGKAAKKTAKKAVKKAAKA